MRHWKWVISRWNGIAFEIDEEKHLDLNEIALNIVWYAGNIRTSSQFNQFITWIDLLFVK